MAKDTIYYDILGVEPTATDIELKKAYRKQAIKLHPDKNGNDPKAAEKFQELGEAYGILQNHESRALYDELGVDGMKNDRISGDAVGVDPTELFSMIFGGDSFKGWIGELSMLTNLSKAADILSEENDESTSGQEVVSNGANLNEKVSDLTISNAQNDISKTQPKENVLSSEAINRKKKQKLSQKQKEEILKLDEESKQAKIERVNALASNLLSRIEKYQASSINADSLNQFAAKLNEEFEDLKIESFGIELLHLIGKIYTDQAHATIHSCKTFGVSKIFSSVKSKTNTVKNGYSILKTALDAQSSVEELVKEQELLQQVAESGTELSESEKYREAEMERIIFGKFLATAWASTRFEVTGVLNKVCNKLLNDKSLSKKERISRAEAVLFIGKQLVKVERSPEEDEEARIFEEMMAEASAKKSKKKNSRVSNRDIEEYMKKVAEEEEAAAAAAAATSSSSEAK